VVESYGFMGGPVMALDQKGRLTVPAHFKEVLITAEQGELLVCKGQQKNLNVFPKSLWPQVKALLNQLPNDPRTAAVRRLYLGSATPVSIDSGGRILVPAELRDFAQLEKEVVFMGLENYFELWDKGLLTEQENALYEGQPIKGTYEPLSLASLRPGA
jgi:MraZ protein